MKKSVITEYKKLKKEGYTTIEGDKEIISLKKKKRLEQLHSDICMAAKEHILKVKEISDKYRVHCSYSDMIRKDSGFWEYEIKLDYNNNFGEGEKHDWVLITYEDNWQYGGECHENESVTFDELISFDENNFIDECENKRTNNLKTKKSRIQKDLKEIEKKVKEVDEKMNARIVGKVFQYSLPSRENNKNFCKLLKDDDEFVKRVFKEIPTTRSVDGPDVTGSYIIEISTKDCDLTDEEIVKKIDSIASDIGFIDDVR